MLAVVPVGLAVDDPVRRIKSPAVRPLGACGQRTQAVCGGSVCLAVVARLSAATRLLGREWYPAMAQAAAAARVPGTSTRMPGPMLLVIVSVLRYWPFEPAGFARLIASTNVARFSRIAWASKLLLPTGT